MITVFVKYKEWSDSGHPMIPESMENRFRILEVENLTDLEKMFDNIQDVKVLGKKNSNELFCGRSAIDGAYVSGVYTNTDGNKVNGIPVHPWSIGRMINPELLEVGSNAV
jgi:hypothetical protein